MNKTDSAVRITHRPTGIVVQCQNERSQSSNKDTAMKMLRAKLIELEERRRQEEIAKEKGEAQDVGWGSQIRSYVLHPTRWSRTTGRTWKRATPRACSTATWTTSSGPSCCGGRGTGGRGPSGLVARRRSALVLDLAPLGAVARG